MDDNQEHTNVKSTFNSNELDELLIKIKELEEKAISNNITILG